MHNGGIKSIRRNGRFYNLFFIKPKKNIDTHGYAERLAGMRNVAEVMVTEGECGFIVKAKTEDHEEIPKKMTVLSRSSYKRIVSYYQYRR
jgi:hypothetical protein